jgi:hypothetical protein
MKKIWFILEENYHRGPFTFDELSLMYEHKKLKNSDSIWREGLSEPVTFKEIHDLEILKLEESIPAIPVEAKLPVLNDLIDSPKIIGKPQNLPNPPKSLPAIGPTESQDIHPASDEGSANNMELPKLKKTSGKKIFQAYFASLGLIIFSVILFIYYQYSFREPKLSEPYNMMNSDHERLNQVVRFRKEKEFKYAIAVSRDFENIWLASNYPYKAKVMLEFSSYPAKTAKNLAVVGQSIGEYEKFMVSFNKFQFTSGDRLVQGIYHFKLKLIEEYPTSLIQRLVYKERKFPAIEFDTYIGLGNEDQFLSHLKANEVPKVEVESEELLKLIEKEERFRTLLTLITMTEEKTSNVIKLIKEKKLLSNRKELSKLIEDYEHEYITEVSPLLSSLGQETNLELSRTFGAHFMSTLSQFRKFSKNKTHDPKKFESFGQESLLKFKELEATIENQLKTIETEISDQKSRSSK